MPATATTLVRPGKRARLALAAATLVGATLALVLARPAPAGAQPVEPGYWLFARDGGVFSFGDAPFRGSTGNIRLNRPIVGAAAHPFDAAYWMVASDGGVFSFGGARFFGSTGNIRLNQPVVGMAAHPSGLGYHLVASDGGIFSFGASEFFGSTGNIRLNKPIVGMASTPSGNGYWLVASDGGIFAFGDAKFLGSTGDIRLNKPIVGMASTPTGNGYWLVATDGGIFAFGDAQFVGSTGNLRLNQPIVGMTSTSTGNGYWLVATDGGIFSFGDAEFLGSTGNIRLNQPILAMAARPALALKVDPFAADREGRTQGWRLVGSDYQLLLSWDGAGDVPAGARVLGVGGLTVDELSVLRFTVEGAGTCPGSPTFNLYVDTNGDGIGDVTRAYRCERGGAGPTKGFQPTIGTADAPALPADAVVTGLDIVLGAPGTVALDDIFAAGITVADFRTFTASGRVIG